MRDADDDQPGPGDSEAFVESMLDQAFAAVAKAISDPRTR
jgi:hypothetical protein